MLIDGLPSLVALHTPLGTTGRIVSCGLPGAYIEEDGALGLSESRLEGEMARFRKLNVDILVSLVEDKELGCVAFDDIADCAAASGIASLRLPIVDFDAPSRNQAVDWYSLRTDAKALLKKGKSVAFHCMAGIGRSGMMAGCLLAHLGLSPLAALKTVRLAQPEALETSAQVSYLFNQLPH